MRPNEDSQKLEECYKDHPGLGDRSIVYPYSSVGDTFTFDAVEDTGSNLASNVSFIGTLARASLNAYVVGSSGIDIAGKSANGRIRYRRHKDPAVPREGECCKDHPGLGNRSIFYSGSSVASTFTRAIWSAMCARINCKQEIYTNSACTNVPARR